MDFDFTKNTEVENLEAVPKDFHGLYVGSDDDGYRLDSDHAGVKSAIAAVNRMSGALKAARSEAKANKSKVIDLSPLKDFGDTPDTILETVTTRLAEAQKGKSADVEKQLASAKSAMTAAHTKELEGKDKRIGKMEKSLRRRLIDADALVELTAAGAIDPELLLPKIHKFARMVETDDGFETEILDANGEVRYSSEVAGAKATMKELALELKGTDRLKSLFRSEARQGGGTVPGSPSRRVSTPGKDERTAAQKIADGLKNRKRA